MRITLKTSSQSFANALLEETGYELQMARSSETLSRQVLRSKPMPIAEATGLEEHLKNNMEAGDGISKLSVTRTHSGQANDQNVRLIIRSDMEDQEYGNIARFMRGEHPGLTFSEIVNCTRFHALPRTESLVVSKNQQPSDHMGEAVRSYLLSLATRHRGYELREFADGTAEAIKLDPVYASNELSVSHAYHTMLRLLHRDRAIPAPASDPMLYNREIISIGAQELGVILDPTANATDKLIKMSGIIEDNMLQHTGSKHVEGLGEKIPDIGMPIAHIMLIDAYIKAKTREYPDIPRSIIDTVCELSHTTPLLNAGQDILARIPDQRFWNAPQPAQPVARAQEHTSRSNGPIPGM